MAGPINTVVLSGFAVSSALYLFPQGPWAISVPSMAGNQVRIDFTTVSGGAGEPSFGALFDPPDQPAVVASNATRPAWGLFTAVTPWCRVRFGAAVTDTASVVLYPARV
jgi:hypothetical protein